MTASSDNNLNQAIENYGIAAKKASKNRKFGKGALVGFGAAAATGLLTASQAEADIIYSGVINAGFNISTVNASSTNAISPPLVFNSTGGAAAFGIAGNDRGPNNAVGSTDILWAVGAAYVGGSGGVFASPFPTFPTTVIPLQYSQVVGSVGTPGSLAWAFAGNGAVVFIDPFGAGSTGSANAFFGFTFNTSASGGGQTNFGWAQVNLTSAGLLPTSMTVIDWAYDNMGNPIHVGSTSSVPEPSGLAGLVVLAMGAAGIRRRKARNAA